MAAETKPFRMSLLMKGVLLAVIALGALCLRLIFTEDTSKGWFNYLIGSVLFLGMSLCGLFFTAIQHLTKARWSVGIRRVMEAMALTLPVSALLFFGVYKGSHSLYEWTHASAVSHDALLQFKQPFLSESWFGARLIIYFLIWGIATALLVRNSFRQDKSGAAKLSILNTRLSAPIMVAFALSVSMAAFDILMSLEPHWFSTIFGVYFFSGFFQAGLAMIYILTWLAYRSGTFDGIIEQNHFHDIARFLFGFSIFWAYIAFSQFLLIWYGNLPEETFFYIDRMNNGWGWIGIALLFLRFVAPFLILMPYGAKRCSVVVVSICGVILLGQWLDIFYFASPSIRLVSEGGLQAPWAYLGWKELGVGSGFVSLFLLIVGMIMERIRMVPLKDPRLHESIHYYHG